MPSYSDHLTLIERQLALRPQAASNRHAELAIGGSAPEQYGRVYATTDGEARLRGRTPFSLDRDRILYSDSFRRQDDKYHVLFFGKTRRARNYTGHALKSAHLARVIAARLQLNGDLSEAIVLGAKVGATPFLHVSKGTVPDWTKARIAAIGNKQASSETHTPRGTSSPRKKRGIQPLDFDHANGTNNADSSADATLEIPNWIELIENRSTRDSFMRTFPWAKGDDQAYYSSGSHSYWNIAVNPFTLTLKASNPETSYTAQVLYGIWRHALPNTVLKIPFKPQRYSDRFDHSFELLDGQTLVLTDRHATYEAMVARYCDDIAWALENLVEASRVDSADQAEKAYKRFAGYAINEGIDLPSGVSNALLTDDSGKLYNFFVDDLVNTSEIGLKDASEQPREPDIRGAISLSPAGLEILRALIIFLDQDIFSNSAIQYRNAAASAITNTALNILDSMDSVTIANHIERLSRIEGWYAAGKLDEIKDSLREPVFRAQACIALLVSMSDRDLFELVGLDT